MIKFKDYLYALTCTCYHVYDMNYIKLDNYIINIYPKNTLYLVEDNYGYESIQYNIEIYDKNDELVYRTNYYKLSANLEMVKKMDTNEIKKFIFDKESSPFNRLYISTSYSKIKKLQEKHPAVAKEVGVVSTKDPDLKVKKEVYKYTRNVLNELDYVESKKLNKQL